MDIFEQKSAQPMLIGKSCGPFDSPCHLFELKLDGTRCLAYLDQGDSVLINKRNVLQLPMFPELSDIHRQVKKRCILDGELIVAAHGKPDFSKLQQRFHTVGALKINTAASNLPASFVAYDILYCGGKQVTGLPLTERKELLRQNVSDGERMSVSRYIWEQGSALFELSKREALEGIVAKHKDSKYLMGKRTDKWAKIKNFADDEYIICGYIKSTPVTSLVLGQYNARRELVYKGRVAVGNRNSDMKTIERQPKLDRAPFAQKKIPAGNQNAVWLCPDLVCTVQFMSSSKGGLRHGVYKGLREDKSSAEVIEQEDV